MLVGQKAGVGREVCWSVKRLGKVGRYVGWSNCWDRQGSMLVCQTVEAGMLVSQTAGLGMQVCWSVIWPG